MEEGIFRTIGVKLALSVISGYILKTLLTRLQPGVPREL